MKKGDTSKKILLLENFCDTDIIDIVLNEVIKSFFRLRREEMVLEKIDKMTRIKDILRQTYLYVYFRTLRKSYSQTGEDCIVRWIFDVLGIKNPSYIDIGAHDPFLYSNTAMFYAQGSRGINIEPDPLLFKRIARKRKKDINLQMGIGNLSGTMPFYVMSAKTLSTFSEKEAKLLRDQHGYLIRDVIEVRVEPLKYVLDKYCDGVFPDFLSLDTEGFDELILSELKMLSSLPKVICVESREYGVSGLQNSNSKELYEMLKPLGYMLFADTYINTIFVLERCWAER